jgi:transposase, IS5 family
MIEHGLFDEDERLTRLSELGDSLEKLDKVVNWEMFRETLNKVFEKEPKGAGGRPPFDYVMMFKILILQRIYNLSDDQTEFQINDRMSFMRFLGLGLSDKIPDAKTIWHFKNELASANVGTKLFHLFNKKLLKAGVIKHDGVIVDATFVEAPKQRNTREENKEIKNGNTPDDWKKDDAKSVHKLCQKDVDARWTVKSGQRYYGYKNHVKADLKSKLILDYTVTSASVHDSNEIGKLVKEDDKIVYADSGYVGKENEMPDSVEKVICEKGCRYRPLTGLKKLANHIKSKVRCRIEHIFGFMTNNLHGLTMRCIGEVRAEFNIDLTNLIYNMFRFETITR